MSIDKSIYYNIDKLLSYSAIINIGIGGRGIGKTYQVKKHLLKKYRENGEQFLYVRRYKEELGACKSLFADINRDFGDADIDYWAGKFWLNDKIIGYSIALSQAQDLKGISLPDISTIYYDEFILEKPTSSYLPEEPRMLLSLYQTINRDREIRGNKPLRIIMTSNFITENNPYFTAWDIKFRDFGFEIKKDDKGRVYLACEKIQSAAFTEAQSNLLSTSMLKALDYEYANYALNNEALTDTHDFVRKETPNPNNYYATLRVNNTLYSVYLNLGYFYISTTHIQQGYHIWTLNSKMEENTISIKLKTYQELKNLLGEYHRLGCIFYNSIRTKNIIQTALKDNAII